MRFHFHAVVVGAKYEYRTGSENNVGVGRDRRGIELGRDRADDCAAERFLIRRAHPEGTAHQHRREFGFILSFIALVDAQFRLLIEANHGAVEEVQQGVSACVRDDAVVRP